MKILQKGYIDAREDFGVRNLDEKVLFDTTKKLRRALQVAAEEGVPCDIHAGRFLYSEPLEVVGNNVMIRGRGGSLTTLLHKDGRTDGLIIRSEGKGSGIEPSGYCMNLKLDSQARTKELPDPYGTAAGVTPTFAYRLSGMRQFRTMDVTAGGHTFGFDMVNNCYGSTFFNVRAQAERNVFAFYLRGVEDDTKICHSGSDISVWNFWGGGQKGGIWASKDAGGYNFVSGQVSGGQGLLEDDERFGGAIIGPSFHDLSVVGGVANISFKNVDFEGWKRVHAINVYENVTLTCENCSFLATDRAIPGLGVIRLANPRNGAINLKNNTVSGWYKATRPITVVGSMGSRFIIDEQDTQYGLSGAYFDCKYPADATQPQVYSGVKADSGVPMVEMSGLDAFAVFRRETTMIRLGKTTLRSTRDGGLESSIDGTTWRKITS